MVTDMAKRTCQRDQVKDLETEESILDYPDGANLITSVLIRGRQKEIGHSRGQAG